MRTIDGFFAKFPSKLTVNVTDAGTVSAYIGVLKRIESNGSETDLKTWQPAELESAAGGQAELSDAKGYNVVIPPIVQAPTKMKVRIRVDGPLPHDKTYTVDVPDNVPFGWRIFRKV